MLKLYMNPSFWFKDEKEKKRMIIKHTLTHHTQEKALAELDLEGKELELQLLKIDAKYKRIDQYDFDIKYAKLTIEDEFKLDKKLLDIEYEYAKLTDDEYERGLADIKKEPYIKVLNIEYDINKPSAGFFELDYNEYFVEFLIESGYKGEDPDAIVDAWFNDICKNIVLEELEDEDGTARSFLSDSKEGQLIQRTRVDDNFSEYT